MSLMSCVCQTEDYDLRIRFSQQKLDMQVNAGHSSCDGALAQEAELVDALQRIQRFQLVGNTLYLLDQSGQRLIQAQKK